MTSNNVQEWFDSAPDDKKVILDTLRQMIVSQSNKVVEEIKWSRPCYSKNGKLFCYLNITKNHVTIGFEKGASLKDTSKLLQGTGKEMRHINLKTLEELKPLAIKQLIEEACNS
ncbi:MAG TPA: DUF1801 domain-containing protein [Anaerolineales bacterium]|nr:DUF1801 domain-containing protein [Anaerolineales bacterium]